jgi:hypothetical protein
MLIVKGQKADGNGRKVLWIVNFAFLKKFSWRLWEMVLLRELLVSMMFDIRWCFYVLDVGCVLTSCLDDANYEALGFTI